MSWFRNLFEPAARSKHGAITTMCAALVSGLSDAAGIRRASRRGQSSAGVGKGLKCRPLAPHPHPRSNRRFSQRKLSYARNERILGKVNRTIKFVTYEWQK